MTLPEAIELIIVTPQRLLLREKVASVQLPGASGELGILPGHAPLITELGNGELSYKASGGGEPVVLAVLSGFAEVLPDRVKPPSAPRKLTLIALNKLLNEQRSGWRPPMRMWIGIAPRSRCSAHWCALRWAPSIAVCTHTAASASFRLN
jgi:ATP synthase delta/epsilon subunit-like protein